MLTRVAESLYWIGRYIERSEHGSRYLKVQYFSTLDAPMSQNRDFTLRSILFMSGAEFDIDAPVKYNEVWQRVIFDANNQNSLFSLSHLARENARSIRNNISTELWEAINKWYLYYKGFDTRQFSSSQIFDFTTQTNIQVALIKSTVYMTILHDDVWNFINLGMLVERTIQTIRILKNKIIDNQILSDNGANIPLMRYQWTTLLKSLEAFDVYNKHMRGKEKNEATIFEFIIANGLFPRSLHYSIEGINYHLSNISVRPNIYENIVSKFEKNKMEYMNFAAFDNTDEVVSFLESMNNFIGDFHFDLESLYFQIPELT